VKPTLSNSEISCGNGAAAVSEDLINNKGNYNKIYKILYI